ncbi:tetraspanin-3-like [Stylophora pistillata]|uniref:Tetraspanin n=1 Tax=Stylophora pistillata TaxID=50429 RepID=A0A2B4S9N1_STYPI|nr:tetraspanin-3-like [Stylophora pistillata]PFX25288.1 CD63 antigen [Stylophora pistillata]
MGFAKTFLFFFNFIYLGVSGAIIYLAVWLIKKDGHITKITTDEYILVPCVILVGIGVLTFITALFGCCGTCQENKCCLSTFFALLLIVFALEIVAGVLGFVYKSEAKSFVEDGFQDAIKNYDDKDTTLDKAVDGLQENLKCCGISDPTDWHPYAVKHDGRYPDSCCSQGALTCKPRNAYSKGCLNKLTEEVKKNLSFIMGSGIGLAVLQLLGMIGACYLMYSPRSGYLELEGGTTHSFV